MSHFFHYLKNLPLVLWLYWGLLLALLYGFALLAEEVLERERLGWDTTVLAFLQSWQTPGLDVAADLLNIVGGAYFLAPLSVAVTVVLWWWHRRSGVFFGIAVGGAMCLNLFSKLVFERSRPGAFEALVPADGFAFPSGHTMGSTAYALETFFVVRLHARRWQGAVLGLGLSFGVAVGMSRLYLQVHYPSDVLSAWLLSSAWVLGVNAWYARARR